MVWEPKIESWKIEIEKKMTKIIFSIKKIKNPDLGAVEMYLSTTESNIKSSRSV